MELELHHGQLDGLQDSNIKTNIQKMPPESGGIFFGILFDFLYIY